MLKATSGKAPKDASPSEVYRAAALCIRDEIMEKWTTGNAAFKKEGKKRLYYISAEFLMGRSMGSNLVNMREYEEYEEALRQLGLDLSEAEDEERDAGLGNGGLGRLAACFLDSFATLGLPAIGCGIRYEYGLFRQRILEGAQVELPDNWIESGNVWEIERPDERFEVRFGGETEEIWTETGLKILYKNYRSVYAVPYDMPIAGYMSEFPSTLRLWSARAAQRIDLSYFNRGDYLKAAEEKEYAETISKVLYPENAHEQGKQLRLKQFYFLASATVQSMVKYHKDRFGDLHTLPDKAAVQINDTHPVFAIPELIRILLDEEGFSWDEAYSIASRVFSYTNHTVMAEALERWPLTMVRELMPRVCRIIETINEQFCNEMFRIFPGDFERVSEMAIISYGEIAAANLCVAVCGKVNGVSQLHADILKTNVFRDFYKAYPQKFCGITNGITQRRWLALCNPRLTRLLTETIGDGFLKDWGELSKVLPFASDPAFLEKFAIVKAENKLALAEYLQRTQNTIIDPNSIIDSQAKRLHEYKRQLLKVLHILWLYDRVCDGEEIAAKKVTFAFAAKAAPGYTKAKNIIRLINAVAELIDKTPRARERMQIVFLENYGVTAAERLLPASDTSEQLSTAGREASGTGNMKFMLSGAVTIGTMDGANIEIYERVGEENIYIFGADEARIRYLDGCGEYSPYDLYEKNERIKRALNHLTDGSLNVPESQFADINHSLLIGNGERADRYYVLYDLESYDEAWRRMIADTENADEWRRKGVVNTGSAGYFSSDRTVAEYNDLIWHLK